MRITNPITRRFGIEIETEGNLNRIPAAAALRGVQIDIQSYNHRTHSAWKIVTDATVGVSLATGGEVVSPILSGEDGKNEAANVARVLSDNGCTVSKKCGFHVHMDISDLDLRGVKNLVKLWLKFETVIESFLSPSRRGSGNIYCKSNFGLFGLSSPRDARQHEEYCKIAFAAIDRARSIDEVMQIGGDDRYCKLNTKAYFRHRTIEFRCHQGTVDAEKITRWIELCNYLVERAKAARSVSPKIAADAKVHNGDFWRNGAGRDLRNFWGKRAAHFAALATTRAAA